MTDEYYVFYKIYEFEDGFHCRYLPLADGKLSQNDLEDIERAKEYHGEVKNIKQTCQLWKDQVVTKRREPRGDWTYTETRNLVRCRNCEYYSRLNSKGYCSMNDFIGIDDDDYCSFGSKR